MLLSFNQYLMLLENRLDFLKSQHKEFDTSHDTLAKHKSASDIVDHFATHADPTPKKVHTQWILRQYKNKNIRQEDHPRIKEALSSFDKYKSKLEHKDINHYKDLTHIESAVEPHLDKPASNREEKRITKHEGADTIHDDKDLSVVKLKTKEAACHYGAGTKWCTAAKHDNAFDHYNKNGPLYVIHDKKNDRKYQIHHETKQYMDERDDDVNPRELASRIPQLKKIKEMQGHIAFVPDHELESKEGLLKHQHVIASSGSKAQRSELLKHKEIDHETKQTIAGFGAPEHKDELLKNHELDHKTKNILAKYSTDKHKTELLKNRKLDHETKASIARFGNHEHRDELLKHHELDHATKNALVAFGNHEHRTELLKHHELDDDAKGSIAHWGNNDHRTELLKHHELDHKTKNMIAVSGDNDHRNELLKNHELDHKTKFMIARFGNNDHRTELLKHHELDHMTKNNIASTNNDEHKTELLKNHELNHETKSNIAYYGNNDHRTELLKHHELDHNTLYHIVKFGNHEHREEILRNHNPDSTLKTLIKHKDEGRLWEKIT